MSGLKEIKNRIASVKNTVQMTKAMKMVSIARLRSAQNRILNLRAYAQNLEELLKDLVLTENFSHPFLEQKEEKLFKKVLVLVLTSDRGLCGAFNGNTCRFAESFLAKKAFSQADMFFIGKKGHDYFKFKGYSTQDTFSYVIKDASYPLSARISKDLTVKILSKDYDAVFIVYNEFKSVISPRLTAERFLPFDLSKQNLNVDGETLFSKDILLEVSTKELLDSLLERYFSIQLYRYLCENLAAEHGSRMVAMENASKNAEEIERSLDLKYNKLRQSSITTELIEIISGAESLK